MLSTPQVLDAIADFPRTGVRAPKRFRPHVRIRVGVGSPVGPCDKLLRRREAEIAVLLAAQLQQFPVREPAVVEESVVRRAQRNRLGPAVPIWRREVGSFRETILPADQTRLTALLPRDPARQTARRALMEGDEQAQQPRAWLNDLSPRQSSSSSPCEAFKAGSRCACRYSSNATLLQPTPPCPRQMPPRQELIPSREEPHLELLRSPLRLFPAPWNARRTDPEEPRRVAVLPRPVPVFPCLRCLSLPGAVRQEQCRGRLTTQSGRCRRRQQEGKGCDRDWGSVARRSHRPPHPPEIRRLNHGLDATIPRKSDTESNRPPRGCRPSSYPWFFAPSPCLARRAHFLGATPRARHGVCG